MGVMERIKAALSRGRAHETSQETQESSPSATRRLAASVAPERPVGVEAPDRPEAPEDSVDLADLQGDGSGTDDDTLDAGDSQYGGPALTDAERKLSPPKKSKQEMLADLQRNYQEVLELVRRVKSHLDLQEERSERLMEIAERIPSAVEHLPELREQNDRILSALSRVAEGGKSANEHAQNGARELARINEQLKQSGQSERELLDAVSRFKDAVGDMADQNQRASAAIENVGKRDEQRQREIADALHESRKWLVIAASVGAAGVLAAIVIAVVALLS